MRTLYVINPAALGGRGGDAWKHFQSLWPSPIDPQTIRFTEGPGHARQIAASSAGYDVLVAIAGDGITGEMLSGIMDRGDPEVSLAIVPAGTGNDAAHCVGVRSVEDAVKALQRGQTRAFDLIRVDCHVDGKPIHRYAFLLSDVGYDAFCFKVLKPWIKRLLGSKASYFFALVMGAASYDPPEMTVRWEDREHSGRTWIVVVGNSEWAGGGGMRIAPGAEMDDGEFNVTIIPARSRTKSLRMIAKSASGKHVEESGVMYFPAKTITVESDPPAGLTMDGDIFGMTPATFTICPRAVWLLVIR